MDLETPSFKTIDDINLGRWDFVLYMTPEQVDLAYLAFTSNGLGPIRDFVLHVQRQRGGYRGPPATGSSGGTGLTPVGPGNDNPFGTGPSRAPGTPGVDRPNPPAGDLDPSGPTGQPTPGPAATENMLSSAAKRVCAGDPAAIATAWSLAAAITTDTTWTTWLKIGAACWSVIASACAAANYPAMRPSVAALILHSRQFSELAADVDDEGLKDKAALTTVLVADQTSSYAKMMEELAPVGMNNDQPMLVTIADPTLASLAGGALAWAKRGGLGSSQPGGGAAPTPGPKGGGGGGGGVIPAGFDLPSDIDPGEIFRDVFGPDVPDLEIHEPDENDAETNYQGRGLDEGDLMPDNDPAWTQQPGDVEQPLFDGPVEPLPATDPEPAEPLDPADDPAYEPEEPQIDNETFYDV